MEAFNIGKTIRGLYRNTNKFINKNLAPHNISEGQFEYFIIIYHNEGINQKELAELMNVGKTSVTKAIQKLIKEDLIIRQVKSQDRRNYGLFISDKGKTFTEIFGNVSFQISSKIFKDIPEADLIVLQKILNKMYENSKNLQ